MPWVRGDRRIVTTKTSGTRMRSALEIEFVDGKHEKSGGVRKPKKASQETAEQGSLFF